METTYILPLLSQLALEGSATERAWDYAIVDTMQFYFKLTNHSGRTQIFIKSTFT